MSTIALDYLSSSDHDRPAKPSLAETWSTPDLSIAEDPPGWFFLFVAVTPSMAVYSADRFRPKKLRTILRQPTPHTAKQGRLFSAYRIRTGAAVPGSNLVPRYVAAGLAFLSLSLYAHKRPVNRVTLCGSDWVHRVRILDGKIKRPGWNGMERPASIAHPPERESPLLHILGLQYLHLLRLYAYREPFPQKLPELGVFFTCGFMMTTVYRSRR
ncbi:hypothetical protein BU17DRAFT_69735 [Hysterangium stoloniferum]|nr:hypothetical protein BU17DRAFT_69735 [Hysterangium stoloniferum]